MTAKRLELLRALVPGAVQIAVLVNPEAPVTETVLRELEDAAATIGLRIRVLKARSSGEINAAFATFVHERPDALFASGGFLFTSRRVQLVHLATRYAVPTAYSDREYVEAGGLMSYGTNPTESLQQVGRYTGRISKAQACGPAGHAVDQTRTSHQRRDRQDARPHCAAYADRPRRRGDRMMRRREFISLLGGAAAAWPLAARAQQSERMRRIGVLLPAAADDPPNQARVGAFLQGLALLGWTIGRNLQIDIRWAGTHAGDIRRHAAELVALAPDVMLASGGSTVGQLLQMTRTVPIVFPIATDPVGSGFVDSLARPGGNATGFMNFEFGMAGKWLELLKQIAPSVTRAAVPRDPTVGSGTSQFAAIQAVAPALAVEVNAFNLRDAGEIERAVAAFARSPNSGLVVTLGAGTVRHRDLIIALAARHKLPAVYPERFFAAAGGLIAYGPDQTEQFRLAAGYVDRILKGEKPADLPVQAPTKYETVIKEKFDHLPFVSFWQRR